MEQAYFNKYMHIEPLKSSEVKGIKEGTVYIYPKIDGTNASIWVEWDAEKNDYVLCGGSRNHKLTQQWDNAGFYTNALGHPEYKEYLVKHPTYIVYGEWLVPHTIRDYDVRAWENFYVFDVYDTVANKYLRYDEYCDELADLGFNVISPILIATNPSLDDDMIVALLTTNHYLMKSEEFIGEGIVIKNYDYTNPYGRTTWAKVVNPTFKNNSKAKFKGGEGRTIEDDIVDKFLTEEAVTHEVLKFKDEYGEYTNQNYAKMLGLVWNGWLEDNVWNIIRRAGKKDINFSTLRRKVENKTKEYFPL